MRTFYVLFLIICLGLVAYFLLNEKFATPPEPTASDFLTSVKKGDLSGTSAFFGDIVCSCPPKGGYSSYLTYESGIEPNLAFLLGHPFANGAMTKTELHQNFPYLLPWEKPASLLLSIPLTFDRASYSPLFLPLPIAFGKQMELSEFQKFVDNPDLNKSRGLSLRIRPSLEPGLVKRQLPLKAGSESGADSAPYTFPSDAGQVVTAAKDLISREEVQSHLPHLNSVMLNLTMERRSALAPWLISHFRFSDAIVQVDSLTPVRLTDVERNN